MDLLNPHYRTNQSGEHCPPVRIPQHIFAGAFGVGHHAEYVAAGVADAGDTAGCAIRVGFWRYLAFGRAVAEQHLVVALQFVERSSSAK